MTITLYNNQSEPNRADKTLTKIADLTSEIVRETSILDPEFLIQAENPQILQNCNYLKCNEFGRDYFVKDITAYRKNIWRVTAHADVLSTYAAQIRQQSAIIARQEELYNLYLNDSDFKVYQNPQIITKAFPSGFTTQSFVIGVAGG